MIYKKHELSLSLNGEDIMHIARNASGVVVFREHSERALKKAIDEAIKEQGNKELVEEEPIIQAENPIKEEVLVPTSTQKRITRGPDGKFISKSQLDMEQEDKKKSFWDKLTS